MKSLLILRHAQAADPLEEQADIARPLTKVGCAQAIALGRFFADQKLFADRVLCSSALRAQQTAQLLLEAAASSTELHAIDALYCASATDLFQQARSLPNNTTRALFVAHAPGVAELVQHLCAQGADLSLMFAPATLSEVVLDIAHWGDLRPGIGSLQLHLPALA